MAHLSTSFVLPIPLSAAEMVFTAAVNHWVQNIQGGSSAVARSLIDGAAAKHLQKGRPLAAAIGSAMAKGQGAKHPTSTIAKVSIPASATSHGGEMTVTATAQNTDATTITIDGRTQGLFGGALKENVSSLSDYLKSALPKLAEQSIRSSGSATAGIAGELERIAALHKSGSLSAEEFARAKSKLLGG